MSGKISGLVWDLALPREQKYVLLAYADHADHEGYGVRPSYDLIAWKTGYPRRSVMRIVEKLENSKLLVVVKQGGSKADGTLGKPTEWRIDVDAAPKTPPRKTRRVTPVTPPPVGGDTRDTHMRVTPVTPDPSVEPSKILGASHGSDAAKKPTPKDRFFFAVAACVYGGYVKGAEENDLVGHIINGRFKTAKAQKGGRKPEPGLIDFETERTGLPASDLDFAALADLVPKFWADLQARGIEDMADPVKWYRQWSLWRNKQTPTVSTQRDEEGYAYSFVDDVGGRYRIRERDGVVEYSHNGLWISRKELHRILGGNISEADATTGGD